MSLRKYYYILLIYWWSRQYPVTDLNTMEEYELSWSFAIDVYICQWLKKICGWRLLNDNDLNWVGWAHWIHL